MKVGTEPKF